MTVSGDAVFLVLVIAVSFFWIGWLSRAIRGFFHAANLAMQVRGLRAELASVNRETAPIGMAGAAPPNKSCTCPPYVKNLCGADLHILSCQLYREDEA